MVKRRDGRISGQELAPRVIPRPRLIESMSLGNETGHVTLLAAPAGYGKTTLLRQWLALNEAAAAISLDRSSRDVAALGRDLSRALAPFSPGLPEKIARILSSTSQPNREPKQIGRALCEDFHVAVSAVVFDDYHEIIGTSSEILVTTLFDELDSHFVVSSRLRPAWATSRQLMYGHVFELTRDDLAMNEDETAQMLEKASGSRRALGVQAEGWPAVLALAARASNSRTPSNLLPATLHRFFADELFGGVSPNVQQQLIHLALLPHFTSLTNDGKVAWSPSRVADIAIELGFASRVEDRLEMHPLIRDFLLSKLMLSPTCAHESESAVLAALAAGDPDAALDLVTRFNLTNLIDPVITASFRGLISTGRIATLQEIADLSHRSGTFPSPLIDLVDAELLFRDGMHGRAEHVAVQAATVLASLQHPLAGRAWWLAGTAAHLVYQDDRARKYLLAARDLADGEVEQGEAAWGLALTALTLEDAALIPTALDELEARRDRSARDLVRWSSGNLMRARITGGLADVPGVDLGLNAVERVSDPHVRTGFLMLYAYHRALQGHYGDAVRASHDLIAEAERSHLGFVRPHALMVLALAKIGCRKVVEAEAALDEVAQINEGRDAFFLANSRILRARIALQEGKIGNALATLEGEPVDLLVAAVRAEFCALRAVVLAVSGDHAGSPSMSGSGRRLSNGIEGRVLTLMAASIRSAEADADSKAIEAFDNAVGLDAFDGIVTALRASQSLLKVVQTHRETHLATIAQRTHDDHLARAAGRIPSRRRLTDPLSPREREVSELLRVGLTNKQIASALFISESTAKLHLRHIFAKLGVRSRTQAVVTLSRAETSSSGTDQT